MSETPSFRAEKRAWRPFGRRQGDCAWSSSRGILCRTWGFRTEATTRLRRFPVRPKKATVSPLGSKERERPATKLSLMERVSNSPESDFVRLLMTLPSFVESSTISASPSERFAVSAATSSPEGLGAKAKTWV
jgi:hypothetical protein